MSLEKRDEISLREVIVRRHEFQLLKKKNRKKQLKNCMKEKACQQMSFTDWSAEKYHLPTACRFYSPEERKEKSSCLCVCYLLFDPRYQQQDN